ncbi:MAG: type II toxin-antitoxin system RelE/ParE family toxin [Thermoflexales bacterium]|nr:type II toxin-antitoxin system RelE/ParE family toxin [Thermoflexales bacterium]
MAAYRVRVLDAAVDDLSRLDKLVGRRIVTRLNWLAANLASLRPEALTGDLTGLYKFRVGDYRILYELLEDERTIVVHQIGHRREVYRKP